MTAARRSARGLLTTPGTTCVTTTPRTEKGTTDMLSLHEGITATRAIRVPNQLWQDARAAAEDRGENLSQAIRDFLETYAYPAEGSDPQ